MTVPLVSICLPNLNTRPFLEERMETIRAQTLTDWELIVCDSYSTDGSWEFFQKFAADKRVQLHQVPRAGIYAGWNECLRRTTGEYVYIATSDDSAESTLLEKMVGALSLQRDVRMATCNVRLIDEQGAPYADPDFPYGKEIYGDWYQRPHQRHGPSEFIATCACATFWNTITAVVMRRSLLDETGYFPETKGSLADYEWALRACLCTDAIHVPEPLATWRVHGSQATHTTNWARAGKLLIGMIEDTLDQFANRLPSGLRDPEVQRRLIRPREIDEYNRLKLHPRTMVADPVRFSRNLATGLRRQPSLTVKHLLRGGRWQHRPSLDLRQWVEEMLAELSLPPICRELP